MQNRRADSTEDYLNVAKDCCALLRRVPVPSAIASKPFTKTSAKSTAPQGLKGEGRSASPVLGSSAASGGGGAGGGGGGMGAGGGGAGAGGGVGGGDAGMQTPGAKVAKVTTEWDMGEWVEGRSG